MHTGPQSQPVVRSLSRSILFSSVSFSRIFLCAEADLNAGDLFVLDGWMRIHTLSRWMVSNWIGTEGFGLDLAGAGPR